jgi:hypothetical protein
MDIYFLHVRGLPLSTSLPCPRFILQVVANAVAALSEINEVSEEDVMLVNSGTLNKLLTALNECTEYATRHGLLLAISPPPAAL